MHAAIIKLDALPDTVRSTAENHDFGLIRRCRLALLLIRRIEVGGRRREFRGAGVYSLVDRSNLELQPTLANGLFRDIKNGCHTRIREAFALQRTHQRLIDAGKSDVTDLVLGINQIRNLHQKPTINAGEFGDIIIGVAMAQRIGDIQQTIRTRHAQLVAQIIAVYIARNRAANLIQSIDAGLKPSQRLLQRLLERAAHGHHLANRLHLCRQAITGPRELFKCEARNLGNNIVDGRLERRWRRTARYVVL